MQPRHNILDAVDDVERRSRSRLENGHQHGVRTVDAHQVYLRRRTVVSVSDVADAHSRAIDGLDRQDVHGLDRIGRVVQMDNIFLVADFLRSDRRDLVLPPDRPDNVVGREAVRMQFLGIDIDLHLTALTAIRRGNRGTLDGRQLRPDEILRAVENFRLRHLVARQGQLDDRHAGGVENQDIGRREPRRHMFQLGLRNGRDLGESDSEIDIRLEENFHHAVIGHGLRLRHARCRPLRPARCAHNNRQCARTCPPAAGRCM